MQITQHPANLSDLELMKRLASYSDGSATWRENGQTLSLKERKSCKKLHANLNSLITDGLAPLMDRVGAREMSSFTMHDRQHGLKVAHLMWAILKPEWRLLLSPAEIAILVISAHLHDLGMGLSNDERKKRLQPDSGIWDKIDINQNYFQAIQKLESVVSANGLKDTIEEASYQLEQAREALLCMDVREEHASKRRYEEIIANLKQMHADDSIKIPDIDACLSFDGDSFEKKLIEVCVSHNEDVSVLSEIDPENPDRLRFPEDYPVGCCVANIRQMAAMLRIADILDFDRERTPPVLFHYLLPRSGSPADNVSIREWEKHLAISNWEIVEDGSIIYRGRCKQVIVHHAIVKFCEAIESEIQSTASSYGHEKWPLVLSGSVAAQIEPEGYRYLPYCFTLDEERIYQLVMGKAIYANRLDAVRELIQNAVDACQLRDALMRRYQTSEEPTKHNRIILRYQEVDSNSSHPRLSVIDTGVGMDRWVIENYLLKVGRSYYGSTEFMRSKAELMKNNLDFEPISEFGIGIMSCFMLGNHLELETAAWNSPRDDSKRRVLKIDGVGRLIEVKESAHKGVASISGTRVTIELAPNDDEAVPTWGEIVNYVQKVVENIPYPLHLEYQAAEKKMDVQILDPAGNEISVPDKFATGCIKIPVNDVEYGLFGQIIILREDVSTGAEAALAEHERLHVYDDDRYTGNDETSSLLRCGFRITSVPGLPGYMFAKAAYAKISLMPNKIHKLSVPVTDVGRSRLTHDNHIARRIMTHWLSGLLDHVEEIGKNGLGKLELRSQPSGADIADCLSLEKHDVPSIYRLARALWVLTLKDGQNRIAAWEQGKGEELPLVWPHDLLANVLLSVILPKITELVVGSEGRRYVKPLKKGWEEELSKVMCISGINNAWPVFATYQESISECVYDEYPNNTWLNERYKDRFSQFTDDELRSLPGFFQSLMHANKFKRRATVSIGGRELLMRVVDVAGDLNVRNLERSVSIKDLVY